MDSWIDIFDTIIKVGLGAIIAGFSAYLIAHYNHKKNFEKENIHRLNKNIYDPIIQHIDEQLILMNKTYWNYVDCISSKEEYIEKIKDHLEEFRQREGLIIARIHMLNDQKLVNLFKDISDNYVKFRSSIADKNINDAFKAMTKTNEIAGNIFEQLLIKNKI